MSKVNGQSVAATEKSLWAGPTLFIFSFHVKHAPVTCGLWPVASACGLWCVLVGGTHPYFLFLLEGWWNTTSPLVPV